MCDKKKQPWDEEKIRPVKDWPGPHALDADRKRNPDLRPYSTIIQEHLDEVHDREDDAEPPYAARVERAVEVAGAIKFATNLEFLDHWKPYELIELLKQKVDLEKVSTDWLRQFREDLDLKV